MTPAETDWLRNKLCALSVVLDAPDDVELRKIAREALGEIVTRCRTDEEKARANCGCTRCDGERFDGWAKRIRAGLNEESRESLASEIAASVAERNPLSSIFSDLAWSLHHLTSEAGKDEDEETADLLEEMAGTERESLKLNPHLVDEEPCTKNPPAASSARVESWAS